MTTRDDRNKSRSPEDNLVTITELLVEFFQGDPTVGTPCVKSIDESLKRIARALEVYAGIVGVANRMERLETGMDFITTQLAALIDTASVHVARVHRGDSPMSTGNRC